MSLEPFGFTRTQDAVFWALVAAREGDGLRSRPRYRYRTRQRLSRTRRSGETRAGVLDAGADPSMHRAAAAQACLALLTGGVQRQLAQLALQLGIPGDAASLAPRSGAEQGALSSRSQVVSAVSACVAASSSEVLAVVGPWVPELVRCLTTARRRGDRRAGGLAGIAGAGGRRRARRAADRVGGVLGRAADRRSSAIAAAPCAEWWRRTAVRGTRHVERRTRPVPAPPPAPRTRRRGRGAGILSGDPVAEASMEDEAPDPTWTPRCGPSARSISSRRRSGSASCPPRWAACAPGTRPRSMTSSATSIASPGRVAPTGSPRSPTRGRAAEHAVRQLAARGARAAAGGLRGSSRSTCLSVAEVVPGGAARSSRRSARPPESPVVAADGRVGTASPCTSRPGAAHSLALIDPASPSVSRERVS